MSLRSRLFFSNDIPKNSRIVCVDFIHVFIVRVFATAVISVSRFFDQHLTFLFLFLLIQHTTVSTVHTCGICEVDESSQWYEGKVFEEEKTCKACGQWEGREVKKNV